MPSELQRQDCCFLVGNLQIDSNCPATHMNFSVVRIMYLHEQYKESLCSSTQFFVDRPLTLALLASVPIPLAFSQGTGLLILRRLPVHGTIPCAQPEYTHTGTLIHAHV